MELVNPFVISGTDLPATQQRAAGVTSTGARSESASPIANDQGELNAWNRKDAMQQISAVIAAFNQGLIKRTASVERINDLNEMADRIRTAATTHNAANFGVLGEEVSNEIRQTVARTGFVRHFLQERELKAGEETKLYVRRQDVMSYSLETDSLTPTSTIKMKDVYSREHYINANIQIEDKELARLTADLLQEKLEDGYEMVQVQEDKMGKIISTAAANATNVPLYFAALTPTVYQGLKNQVESLGLPVASAWLANNLWNDIVSDNGGNFSGWFDPVSKHELILTGQLGSLLGVTLFTDAFINAPQRVLSAGQIFFYAAPGTVGQWLVRKQLTSQPLNFAIIAKPAQGWFLSQAVAPIIGNSNGVAMGQRLT
jgi:hypothetical protein